MSQSTPQSLPVPPAQPDLDSYSTAGLELFQTFTRDSYLAAFKVQAPPYDPLRVTKTWFDTSVASMEPGDIVLYRIIAQDDKRMWRYRQLAMPSKEASSVNLPGAITYPPYVIAPTTATRGGAGIYPDDLSLDSEAKAMLAELGITATLQEQNDVFAVFKIDYQNDPRRTWQFPYGGGVYNIGQLLKEKNNNGLGSPGHWQITATTGIVWVPDPAPTGLDDTRMPQPMPVRELLANETLTQTLFGPVIVRTDRYPAPAPGATGQFTTDDRAMLREIHDLLTQLAPK